LNGDSLPAVADKRVINGIGCHYALRHTADRPAPKRPQAEACATKTDTIHGRCGADFSPRPFVPVLDGKHGRVGVLQTCPGILLMTILSGLRGASGGFPCCQDTRAPKRSVEKSARKTYYFKRATLLCVAYSHDAAPMGSLRSEDGMNSLQRRFKREIEEMVEVCRCAAERKYATSHGGNLSWRVAPDAVLITPTKVNKGKLRARDIVIVGMDQKVRYAANGRRPTGEVYIHIGIFLKRPDAVSIIHAHPAWMTALALSKPELLARAYLPEPTTEVGPVAVTEYAQPLTEKLARTFDPVIMRHNAFLMRNHGVVVLSLEGLRRCFELLEMLEVAAKSIAIAEMLGGARPLSRKEVKGLTETMRTRNLRLPGAPGMVKKLTDLF